MTIETLHSKTFELLKKSKETLINIHSDTGISYYWLLKFKTGAVRDPSVNRVQKLYEYLTNTKLKV